MSATVLQLQPQLRVHRAQLADIPQILPQLRDFAKFVGTKKNFYPGDEHAVQTLVFLIQNHPFFVTKLDGQITGLIAGLVTPHLFNPAIRSLTELFWWVAPEHRGSRAGILLLETLKAWAEQHVDMLTITLEHNSPVNPRTLLKRGFSPQETSYILQFGG